MEGRKEAERERNDGGLGSGDGGLSMHAEPQIHSPRLGLRTSHTHTNTHIPTPPSPETPSGPVVFLHQVGLATSQTASITSHALTAWTSLWPAQMGTLCSRMQLSQLRTICFLCHNLPQTWLSCPCFSIHYHRSHPLHEPSPHPCATLLHYGYIFNHHFSIIRNVYNMLLLKGINVCSTGMTFPYQTHFSFWFTESPWYELV